MSPSSGIVHTQVLQELVAQHQEARSKVTDAVAEQFTGVYPSAQVKQSALTDNLFAGLSIKG